MTKLLVFRVQQLANTLFCWLTGIVQSKSVNNETAGQRWNAERLAERGNPDRQDKHIPNNKLTSLSPSATAVMLPSQVSHPKPQIALGLATVSFVVINYSFAHEFCILNWNIIDTLL